MPQRLERRIIKVRVLRRWGPARIGYLLGVHPSTVHRVLTRFGLARLSWLDRSTGQVIRRYEHPHPGDLIHLDIKKIGKIPDGGGWRYRGRRLGTRNARATNPARSRARNAVIGYHYLHTALDDHSRLAYSEFLPNQNGPSAAAFFTRARTYFTSCGITTTAVLTDNGACYRSRDFAAALAGITHRRTRPYRPQTNGKVERFHRTLTDEWAYARLYHTDTERCEAFTTWLHTYNHHRNHTSLAGQPPASRVPNLSGQNN